MKINIRNLVFETNSSSIHTVSIKGEFSPDNILINVPRNIVCIVCYLDEYGWYGSPCNCFILKLEYAMSMVLHTEYPNFEYWNENFVIDEEILHNLEGYKMLLNTINTYVKNCNEIKICRRDGYFYPYGYIDHQSCENYNCLQDFFDDWDITPERFLFDDNVVVYISNDNV